MARKVNATKSKSKKRFAAKAKAAPAIVAWQDDPLSKLPTIQAPSGQPLPNSNPS